MAMHDAAAQAQGVAAQFARDEDVRSLELVVVELQDSAGLAYQCPAHLHGAGARLGIDAADMSDAYDEVAIAHHLAEDARRHLGERHRSIVAAMAELARRKIRPTHLYYFATPRITRSRGADLDPSLLREFNACYVESFSRVCTLAGQLSGTTLRAFYPSTVFLDGGSRDNPEYVMAKAAGEALCAQMNRSGAGVSVLVERLPRIATDQTATLLKVASADALEVLPRDISSWRLLRKSLDVRDKRAIHFVYSAEVRLRAGASR